MIRDISETKCSMCGAGISSEKWEGQHTNGHRNEYRSFDCGKKLRFSPNFMKVLVENDCERNPLHKEIMEKRKKSLSNLRKYITKMKTDEKFKEKLLYTIKYTNPDYVEVDLKSEFPRIFYDY